MRERLTNAQIELLRAVDACRSVEGEQLFYMRPTSEYWYDARPDNAKIDRLIRARSTAFKRATW